LRERTIVTKPLTGNISELPQVPWKFLLDLGWVGTSLLNEISSTLSTGAEGPCPEE